MSVLSSVSDESTRSLRAALERAKTDPRQYNIEEVDRYGNTALLKACYLGKRFHVELLLQYAANIRAINVYGQNALTLATYSGYLDVVQVLLKYRDYHDFNRSSILPAMCVAALQQDQRMLDFYKRFSNRAEDVTTAHGLTAQRICEMIKSLEQSRSGKRPAESCAPSTSRTRLF